MWPLRSVLKWAGLGSMLVLTSLSLLVIALVTLDDPGGWLAIGLICSWAVPTATLSFVVRHGCARAERLLWAVLSVVVTFELVTTLAGDSWGGVEDRHGPVRWIVSVAMAAPLTIFAIRSPRPGAVMFSVLAAATVVPALIVRGPGSSPLAGTAAPLLVAAVLLLVATRSDRSGDSPAAT